MSYGNMGYTNKYKTAGVYGQSQCEIEAGALVRTAAKLNEAKKNFDTDHQGFNDALLRNRKLWSVLISNLGNPDNGMSHDLRQGLANLAYFIFKHTIKTMASRNKDGVDVLIEINMNVAKGLTSDRLRNQQSGQNQQMGAPASPATATITGNEGNAPPNPTEDTNKTAEPNIISGSISGNF